MSKSIGERIRDVGEAAKWVMEFGISVVYVAIAIPFLVAFAVILLCLPAVYLLFAFQSNFLVSIYLFTVFGGVAGYFVYKFHHRHDTDDPGPGAFISSESDVSQHSSSLINRNKRRWEDD